MFGFDEDGLGLESEPPDITFGGLTEAEFRAYHKRLRKLRHSSGSDTSEDCDDTSEEDDLGVYDAPAGFRRWELDEITDPDERVKWMKKGWDPKRHLGTQIGIVGMRHPGSIDGVDMSDPDIAACVKVISNDDLMTTEEFDRLLEENDAELDRVCKRRDRMTNEERALLALYYVAADIQDRGILQLNYHSALAAELRKVLEQCRPFVADML